MTVLRNAIVGLLGVTVVAAGVFTCASDDLCGNTLTQSIPSPDGKRRADIFIRNCGATTRFSTQVSVVAASASPVRGAGNAFIAYETPVLVRWRGDVVEISYPTTATVFHRYGKAKGVRITFAPLPAEPPP